MKILVVQTPNAAGMASDRRLSPSAAAGEPNPAYGPPVASCAPEHSPTGTRPERVPIVCDGSPAAQADSCSGHRRRVGRKTQHSYLALEEKVSQFMC